MTTLAALTFHDTFNAGASYYGISDLEVLQHDTHKFESRYNETLIGPYPEAKDVYRARSPIHFTDRLNVPIILFQGLEDKVVPPNQSEMMADAARRKGLMVKYVAFEGEQQFIDDDLVRHIARLSAVSSRNVLECVEILAPGIGHAAGIGQVVFVHLFDVGCIAPEEIGVGRVGLVDAICLTHCADLRFPQGNISWLEKTFRDTAGPIGGCDCGWEGPKYKPRLCP